ncbi:uncharacterized protein UMAG_03392 [Mycosarcoma maydis]|uniref:Uncharacterized protein n=1 Tax=Mycosarcoma maydis TaxID=5270 RepID=A0A0D1CNP2_MYCMD|nr:uncharacterized protein UMAG_03392 [Ustilago maydis 521]KIS68293.1 hypothetical protein UMAG_03392 [Ustilago maydis 521]|eukprot:XP_011389868.1 hypothetical protein UMAG_03392 [Ustilago maydis 521]
MKFTILSIMALAAAVSVSALPSDSAAVRAREVDPMAQFASLHMLERRGLSNGKKCKEDSQCDSDFCKNPGWFRSNVCEAKLTNGHECDHDNHCVSGYCKRTSRFRAKKCETNTIPNGSLRKGATCDRNAECKSQICEDILGFKKCVTKETGESCSTNDNCDSGFCFIKPKGANHRCLAVNLAHGKHCVDNVQCASKKCNNICE